MRGTLLGVLALVALAAAACGYPDPYASTGPVANESPAAGVSPTPGTDNFNDGAGLPVVTYPDGLKYVDLKVGTGVQAKSTDRVEVQYTGWLSDGTKFDSSRDRNAPFAVVLGARAVIPGWDEGIPGMRVGGKRKLIIPPQLAYGAAGRTDPASGVTIIPPNETLTFDVELLSAKPGPSPTPSPSPKPSPSPSPSPSATPSKTP